MLELSARGPGHIAALCEIAPPRLGVVLCVGHAHEGEFGGIDEVARAKGELPAALPAGGVALLNADDPRVGRDGRPDRGPGGHLRPRRPALTSAPRTSGSMTAGGRGSRWPPVPGQASFSCGCSASTTFITRWRPRPWPASSACR